MKRGTLVGTILSLALMMSACGGPSQTSPSNDAAANSPPQQEGTFTPANTDTSQGDRNPTAQELGREETTVLTFSLEGQQEEAPATLYIGQGYSLYIPDEGWRLDRDAEDLEESWESTADDDVQLTVRCWPKATTEEMAAYFQRDEDDYTWQLQEDGSYLGYDAHDRGYKQLYLYQRNEEGYTVTLEYPEAAAEGFGVRLSAMADSFAVMK
ncbi:MAG: hypothetical protein PHD67_10825 [Oscillospiraceae bacterium]|nr:hypothetical protein [Oscillospiraceae bacterium]